jgi:hypothetical protein
LLLRKALHFGNEIGLGVKNDVVSAVFFRELRLFVRGNGSDHGCIHNFRDLHERQTCSTGGGMNQAGLAAFKLKSGMRQIVRRHALQHDGGSIFETDIFRQDRQAAFPAQQHIRHRSRVTERRQHAAPTLNLEFLPTAAIVPEASLPSLTGFSGAG